MDLSRLERVADNEWRINPFAAMRVPGIVYADADLIRGMDDKVYQQIVNVATLPGIIKASYAMPDAHWGYGFAIGGVAAFDAAQGGVVSAGGVGFDISCGVRTLTTGLTRSDIETHKDSLADALFSAIPAGLGSTGTIRLNERGMQAMLTGGARWAVSQGYGYQDDLQYIEEYGCMAGALTEEVSQQARRRQRDEMGTLGSGNHYLEVQRVIEIYDRNAAQAFALNENDIVVSIHCGSRGLGHQIGTEFLKSMAIAAHQYGIELPDRELACAPINSPLGESYLGAMRAGINCALANRQILTHLARRAFERVVPRAELDVLYDVSHNTCKQEEHVVDGKPMRLFVHRKGATRALGPGHADLPEAFRETGQPVLVGGSMGTASYILAGLPQSEQRCFASACHGAGRAMSRRRATKQWHGRQVIDDLSARGILIRSHSYRGVAEEAPGAYKDVDAVVDAAENAGLARKVVKLAPVICVKG